MAMKNGEEMDRHLKVIEKQLKGKQYLVGNSLSAADIAMGSLLLYMKMAVKEVWLPQSLLARLAHQLWRNLLIGFYNVACG
jgi:glutathione S-transferase